MVQAVSRQPLTAEVRGSTLGGQSGTGVGFAPRTLVSLVSIVSLLNANLFVYHRCCIMLAILSVVKQHV